LAGGAAATQIVAGMQAATAISVGLLVLGLVLACFVHPESHAVASGVRRASAASK
ncbi:hypothetical protein BH160DRAFT_4857, partial [Burkholderia sp. H160]